jgi:protein associated with RNAse G/E
MGADTVQVIYRKYDGSPHRAFPSTRLGEDEHGAWLGVPDGTVATVGTESVVRETSYVLLVPRDAWFTALFNPPPRPTEVYCDIVTPARWSTPNEVALVDVDLDVRRRRESRAVELLDEDEFAVHAARYGYPEELTARARATAAWLVRALADGSEPFASAYRPWLASVPAAVDAGEA